MSPNPNYTTIDDAPPKRTINAPGKKSVGHADHKEVFEEITKDMLLSNIHLVPKGFMTEPWERYYHQTFDGTTDKNGAHVPGIMSHYKKWSLVNGNEGTVKFMPMVWNGIQYYAKEYEDKARMGCPPTDLDMRASRILMARQSAVKSAKGKTAEKKAHAEKRSAISKAEEEALHLRVPITSGQERARRAVECLAKQPRTANCGNASRAAAEARSLAEAAADKCETINYGPGEKPKTPRSTDAYKRTDNLFMALNQDANTMSSAMQTIVDKLVPAAVTQSVAAEDPTTKKYRMLKELSAIIRDMIAERKDCIAGGLSTKDVDEQLKNLQEERHLLTCAVGRNLQVGHDCST